MNISPQVFLRLVEAAKTICFFDIEATGLKGDYNTVLVVSVRPWQEEAITFSVQQPGNDQRVVREAKACLEQFDCWCSYYGKGFDIKMLDTRLLKWGLEPIARRHHIDLFYTLKSNLEIGRAHV